MEYRKNLIILSGDRGRGAVTVETTAHGSVCRASVRVQGAERLYLAVKDGNAAFAEKLTGMPIELPFTPTQNAHYIVINAKTRQPVLYGTLSDKRLWRANMTDGVLKYVLEKESGDAQTVPRAQDDNGVEKTQIRAEKKINYDDEAIAVGDYYPKGYGEIEKLNSFYRNKPEKPEIRRSFSSATREYLDEYNRKLIRGEKNCGGKRSMFSLQLQYVLHPGEVRDAKIERFRRERASGMSIKSREPVRIEKNAAKVIPVAADFYDEIRVKMDKLFDTGDRMKSMEERMPDTKWVKIPYEKSGYYVVGIIGTRPDYIAYGLPGAYSAEAPEELGKSARWWPLDAGKPDGDGVWLLYQDARTGESVADPM